MTARGAAGPGPCWVAAVDPTVAGLAGTGFCGALTAYSTVSYETFAVIEGQTGLLGAVNVIGSVLVGVVAANDRLGVRTRALNHGRRPPS